MPTAVITGATAGIGRGFADALGRRGHRLVLVARDADRLAAVAEQIRGDAGVFVEVLPADLSDPQGVAAVADRLRAGGPDAVDVLVNNAGFGIGAPFHASRVEDEQALLDVLVTAPMRLTHAALPGMLERGQGTVINVSSIAGWINGGTYSAAKAWLTTFSESLAAELAGTGVGVTVVCPGFVRTEFHERAGIRAPQVPAWCWLTVPQVVEEALAAAGKGRPVSVPSVQYRLIGAMAQYSPRPLVRAATRLRGRTLRTGGSG
jgi:short-subunit dehydrogenase